MANSGKNPISSKAMPSIRRKRTGFFGVTRRDVYIWLMSVLDSYVVKRFRGVAARTVGAEATIVYIVLLVAMAAGGG